MNMSQPIEGGLMLFASTEPHSGVGVGDCAEAGAGCSQGSNHLPLAVISTRLSFEAYGSQGSPTSTRASHTASQLSSHRYGLALVISTRTSCTWNLNT